MPELCEAGGLCGLDWGGAVLRGFVLVFDELDEDPLPDPVAEEEPLLADEEPPELAVDPEDCGEDELP